MVRFGGLDRAELEGVRTTVCREATGVSDCGRDEACETLILENSMVVRE